MANDVTWWNQRRPAERPNQDPGDSQSETPGDTDAADIVSRTGEEMPEVAHDRGPDNRSAHGDRRSYDYEPPE